MASGQSTDPPPALLHPGGDQNTVEERWEKDCELSVTPLDKFYKTWRKLRDRELMHRIAAKDQVVDVELPQIKRPTKATDTDKKEFSALFDSDSDDEGADFTESFLPPDEKKKLMKEKMAANKDKASNQKSKKIDNSNDDDDNDDYDDFDSDELEQLAGSGSDGEDADYDDGKDDDDDDNDHDSDSEGDEDVDNEDDDGIPDKDDIVKEFTMSSDDEDD